MEKDKKPWYQNKLAIFLIVISAIIGISSLNDDSSKKNNNQAPVQNVQPTSNTASAHNSLNQQPNNTVNTAKTANILSNDNYYTNTYGNKVHSPAYSNSVPTGASARCRDGSYSFSQNRRGTCSRHGGVDEWL